MFKKIFFLIAAGALIVGCSSTRQAQVALQQGQYDKAIATYEAHLRGNPEDVTAREGLVRAYMLNHDFDKALRVCQEVTDPSPEIEMYAGLAQAHAWDFQAALTTWACQDFTDQPELAAQRVRMITLIDYVAANSQPQTEMQLEHIELVNGLDHSLYGGGGTGLTMDQLNAMALEVIQKDQDREATTQVVGSMARSLSSTLDEIARAGRYTGEGTGFGGGADGGDGGGGGGGGG